MSLKEARISLPKKNDNINVLVCVLFWPVLRDWSVKFFHDVWIACACTRKLILFVGSLECGIQLELRDFAPLQIATIVEAMQQYWFTVWMNLLRCTIYHTGFKIWRNMLQVQRKFLWATRRTWNLRYPLRPLRYSIIQMNVILVSFCQQRLEKESKISSGIQLSCCWKGINRKYQMSQLWTLIILLLSGRAVVVPNAVDVIKANLNTQHK